MREEMVTSEQGIMLYAEVGLSENTFYRNVREGKIRKYLPEGRQRDALYNAEDIRTIVEFYRRKRKGRVEAIRTLKEGPGKTDWVQSGNLPYLVAHDYDVFGMLERLIAATSQPSALNSDALSAFEFLTQACWRLCNSGQLIIAQTTLSSFFPALKQVAASDSSAASLASRALHLQSILSHHILNKPTDKITICQHSVALAKQSGDYSTLVTTLTELAVAYRYAEQYEEVLRTCQENVCYCDRATPLVQARAYAEAALAFALRNRRREASFYLDLAQDIFPDHPEQDASFWFADSGYHVLVLRELFIHLKFGEAEAAWDTFEQYKKHAPPLLIPERYRLEILNAQGRAALLGNDLEKYASCLEEGIAGAIALKSKKRLAEAYSIFQQDMPTDWLQHQKIKPIVERYHLQPDS
jgi:tetratricopeptide (TPR) repeat protein